MAAIKAAHPIDIESRAAAWADEGWNGINGGQEYWLNAGGDRDAAGSEGITASGVIAGDYGAVGSPRGGRADTNILRGQAQGAEPPEDAVVVNDDPAVRVYQV